MIRDENLRSGLDYNERQKEAAYRVLVELINLFKEYQNDILLVGGWVPYLMFPDEDHIGSVDVDILINHLTLKDMGYQNMASILKRNDYREHPYKYFSFVKDVIIDGETYPVDVDILAGMYGGNMLKKRSQHVQGIKALKATGGNFAFEFPPQKVKIEARRPDGAMDSAHVNVVAVVPYLIMKTAAMGRGKPKDAYDIYFLIKHYTGGVKELAKSFYGFENKKIVLDMKQTLRDKFASVEHSGPEDIVKFMDISDNDDMEITKRDAYEQIHALLELI